MIVAPSPSSARSLERERGLADRAADEPVVSLRFGCDDYPNDPAHDSSLPANFSSKVANGKADFTAGADLRPTGAVDIPNIDDTDLFSVKTGVDFKIIKGGRIGVFYWYERYTIDDFAENQLQEDLIFIPIPGQSPAVGGAITLNEIQPNYKFNSGWFGFIYNW